MLIDEILDYLRIATDGLICLSVFIILIVVVVNFKKKELGSDCKKGFLKIFIRFLIFLMFSTFFDLAYIIINKIVWEIQIADVSSYIYFRIMPIVWIITYGFAFLNQFIAFILLFGSMEKSLFNKKSKGKFGLLSILLLCGAFLLVIVEIGSLFNNMPPGYFGISNGLFIYFDQLSFEIYRFVVIVLTNSIYLIIGIIALLLLKKTAEENELLQVYTKQISIGVILLFIAYPLLNLFSGILTFISLMIYNAFNFDLSRFIMAINVIGIFSLSCIIFIRGITNLAKGVIKTMDVPLTFSKEI